MPYEALRPVGDDNNTNCFTTQILVSHLESKKYCQNFGKHFDDRKFRHIVQGQHYISKQKFCRQ